MHGFPWSANLAAAVSSDTPRGYGARGRLASMSKQQLDAPKNPFGGLSIDFSGDTSVAAPTAPAPLPGLTIDFGDPDAAAIPVAGGPSFTSAAPGRTESKVIIVGSGPA